MATEKAATTLQTKSLKGWDNAQRVGFLFGTFDDADELTKDVTTWWLHAFEAHCRSKGTYWSTPRALADAMQAARSDSLRPLGLHTTLAASKASSALVDYDALLADDPSTVKWLVEATVVTPVSYVWSWVAGSDTVPTVGMDERLVSVKLLDEFAAALSTAAKRLPAECRTLLMHRPAESVMRHAVEKTEEGVPLTLTALCSTVPTLKRLSQACLEGVVARLVKKKLAHIVEDAGGLGKAVIFGHPFASQEVDGPLLSLRITMARLSKVVRSLEERAAASRRQATLCHRAKDKQGTLFHLKRHKLILNKCHQQRSALGNVQDAYDTVVHTTDNATILDAYKVAATALKSTNAQVTADDVDDAATELQAEMETADSVAAALAEPVTADGAEDEELLAELAALEKEMSSTRSLSDQLPSVTPRRQAVAGGAGGGAGAGAVPAAATSAAATPAAVAAATPLPSVGDLESRLAALATPAAAAAAAAAATPAAQPAAAPARQALPG